MKYKSLAERRWRWADAVTEGVVIHVNLAKRKIVIDPIQLFGR